MNYLIIGIDQIQPKDIYILLIIEVFVLLDNNT